MRKMVRNPLFTMIALALTSTAGLAQDGPLQAQNEWFTAAQDALQERLARQPITNQAKNVILMVADGNGVGTNMATRIFHGQQQGGFGEENVLPYEAMPYLALAKTYNTNAQIPDSSGTATAMQSGVKTKAGTVGVDETVARGDCSLVEAGTVTSIGSMFSAAGKSTGLVSTARVTHATPASGYAHSADRNFEDDSELPEGCQVPDIATQLLEAMKSGEVDVAMGGGRRHFIPVELTDEEGKTGRRTDGRNLIEEAMAEGADYVFDDTGLAALDLTSDAPLLALFESSHMLYENDRTGEPSLAEMSEIALTKLSNNEEGFYLHIEAGRVDHANHDGNLHRTVTDGVAFAEAVAKVQELIDPQETLLIVTADHAHAIAYNGYCGRGTPITGLCYGIDPAGTAHNGELQLADDGRPYTVASYLNGSGSILKKEPIPSEVTIEETHADASDSTAEAEVASAETGTSTDAPMDLTASAMEILGRFAVTTEVDEETGVSTSYRWIGTREELTQEQATDPDFIQQALLPRSSETHSGVDVAIYASGPFSHLFDGTVEQNYIFHVMQHAVFGAEAQ